MARKYKAETVKHMFSRYITAEEPGHDEYGLPKLELRVFCPCCEDPDVSKTPSAMINATKGVWRCMGKCGQSGSIVELVDELKNTKGFNPRAAMMKGRNQDPAAKELLPGSRASRPAATQDQVDGWVKRLFGSARLEEIKSERGFTDDTLRKWEIGWDGSRYTIPVRDLDGSIVNVRRYTMTAGAKGDKMLNVPGHGSARIFAPNILVENSTILVTEGETDCILANQYGVPAVTHTAGAATFKKEWGQLFKGKTVYIAYDNDEGGKNGALKVAKTVAPFAEYVYIITIPIPVKGADVTDYLHKEGKDRSDLEELMAEAHLFNSNNAPVKEVATIGRKVSLEESQAQEVGNEVLEMTVTVSGKNNPPYTAPSRFTVNCDMGAGPRCNTCPVFAKDGEMHVEFTPDDTDLFRFISSNEKDERGLLKEISGARCTTNSEFEVMDRYVMEELFVANSVDERVTDQDQKPINRTVFSVGTHKTDINTTVHLVGKNTTHPKNNRLAFMAWKNEPVVTSLDEFHLENNEAFLELGEFTVNDSVEEMSEHPYLDKCLEIAGDLADNVTHIYGRELLHVAYDLVWHSPIAFRVEGRLIEKGWLEMMVVGDTRTGKSEVAHQLARHYKQGVVKSCEGATFAGLVGGVSQPNGGSWSTTWGVIPLNDRRLVVLDEVSGLKDANVIEQMSAIRSSGRAQITKIDTQETSARTRLIWITNPADGSMIDDKPEVGLAALRTVVAANEDIARFDYVMALRASEVNAQVINKTHTHTQPRYTTELCSRLVLWVWSLKPDQIEFTAEAVARCQEIAAGIGEEYIPDPPLLQMENARFKIYRIAAAIAARTRSTYWRGKDDAVLRIYPSHIDDAKKFLDMVYDSPGMQYRSKSKKIISGKKRAAERRHACKVFLQEYSDTVLNALQAIGGTTFKVRDFREFAGMSEDDAQMATKKLLDWRMIHRKSRGDIAMDAVLVSIIREIEDEEDAL